MHDLLLKFFGNRELFPVLAFLTSCLGIAFLIYLLRVKPENAEKMEKIPRWKIPGFVLGLFVLAWCVPHTMPILPEGLHKYLIPAMLAAAIASWFVLDHLFARALGGYMILTAHLFLRESYGVEGFGDPLFAAVCLIYGTLGIFLCGLPYRLRDLIRLELKPKYRWIFPVFLCILSAELLWAGIRSLRWF